MRKDREPKYKAIIEEMKKADRENPIGVGYIHTREGTKAVYEKLRLAKEH